MDQESQRRLPTDAVPAARDERLGRNDSGGAADNRSNTRDCSDIGIDIDDHAIAAALQEEYSAAEARSSLHQDRRVPPEPVSEDHSIAAKTKGKSIGDSESQSSAQPEAPAADSDDHAIAAALQEEEEHLAKETKGKSRGEAASQPSIQTESPAADSDDHAIAAALQEEFLKEAESEAAGSGSAGSGSATGSWLGGAEDWLRGLFPTLPGRGEGGQGRLSRGDAPGHERASKGLSPPTRRNLPGGRNPQAKGTSPVRGVSPKGVSPARGFSPAKRFQAGKGRSPVRGVSPMRWLAPVVRTREPETKDAVRDPAPQATPAAASAHLLAELNSSDKSSPLIGPPDSQSSPSIAPPESQSSPFITPAERQSSPSIFPIESQSSPWIGPGTAPEPISLTRSLSDPAEVTLAYSHIQAGHTASPGGYEAGNMLTVSPENALWVKPSLQSTPVQSPRVSSPGNILGSSEVRLKSPGALLEPPGVTCADESSGASPAIVGSPHIALPARALSPDLFAASPPVPNRRLVLQMAEREREREREQEKDSERERDGEQENEQGQVWNGRAEDDHDQQSNNDYNDESADEENDGYKDDDNGGAEQQEELDGDFALAMKLASEELKNAGLSSNEPPTAGRSLTRLFTRSNSVLHSMRVNSGRLPSLRESLSSHQTLTERLAVYGLRELPMVGDGNCQFRALADQLFRNANRHAAVRQAVVQQMRAHSERYSPYVPDSFSRYLRHMARNGEWGDHITLQAAADKYGAKINLITSYPGDQFLIEIFPCQGKPTKELWLSFWAEVHYNSVYSAESLPPPQPKKKHWLFA